MKNYTIKKGDHYSFHLPKIHFGKNRLVFDFMFTDSCAYFIENENRFDWNKLFGIGFGVNHHKNSYRIGWRYDVVSHKIQLAHYYYNNKKREFPDLCSVDLNRIYRMYINFDRTTNTIWSNVSTYVKEENPLPDELLLNPKNKGEWKSIFNSGANFNFSNVPKWGFYLFPYMGGDEPAQHDTNILLEKIS